MLFLFWPLTRNMGYGLTSAEGIACAYGGLRGAVGLALALIIDEDHRFEEETRELAVFLMSGIAFLTLTINATTTSFVLASVGLTRVSSEVTTNFELNAKELAIDVLKELEHTIHDNEFITNVSMQRKIKSYE